MISPSRHHQQSGTYETFVTWRAMQWDGHGDTEHQGIGPGRWSNCEENGGEAEAMPGLADRHETYCRDNTTTNNFEYRKSCSTSEARATRD